MVTGYLRVAEVTRLPRLDPNARKSGDFRHEATSTRCRMKKWLWRCGRVAILSAIGSYVGVCLVLMWFENSLVYHPAKAQDDWEPQPVADIEDVFLTTASGTRIHAWWLPCSGAELAVLYCHGNAGNLSHRGGSIVKMREILRTHVLIFDYPGYGKSEGRPSERGCYEAADAAYAHLTDARHVAPGKVLLYGGSLGGGVAVDIAARKPQRALILAKTFTCAPDTGAAMFPWLPVRWLMCNRYDNITKIKQCTRPVFIA